MDVIILAGGLGTRLQCIVSDIPKCMAPIANKPFLYYLLKYLTKFKIERIILSVGYQREKIFKWVDREDHKFPFELCYAIENEPLGTGGGIKNALSITNSNDVCIINGDTFFEVDLNIFKKQHEQNLSLLSLALKPLKNFDRYGNVEVNDKHIINNYNEKSFCKKGQINGGIYILKKDANLFSNYSEKFSFETDFLQKRVSEIQMYGFIYNDYFIDIGEPEDYSKAQNDFKTIFQ